MNKVKLYHALEEELKRDPDTIDERSFVFNIAGDLVRIAKSHEESSSEIMTLLKNSLEKIRMLEERIDALEKFIVNIQISNFPSDGY